MDLLEILAEATQHVKAVVTPLIKTSMARRNYGTGAGGDTKRYIDLEAERALVETLTDHNLDFTLISEETGIRRFGSKPNYYVTTDPVDGTTNILRGLPIACTSIAVSKQPRLDAVEAGAVTDIFHDAIYLAQKKLGAYRNYQKISPAQTRSLDEAIIAIDFNSYKVEGLLGKLNKLLRQSKHFRHLGANALELCFTADGTIDAFVDIRGKLRATDIAAAALIIQEAGAAITTPQNTPLEHPLSPSEKLAFIASGNNVLHEALLKALK